MFQVKKIKKWSIRDRNNIRTSELMNFISGWTIPLRDILHWKSCHVFWLSGMLLRGISKQTFALSFSSTQTSVILWKNNRIVHSQNAPRSRVQCPVSGACQGRSCIFSAIWQREAQTSHLNCIIHNNRIAALLLLPHGGSTNYMIFADIRMEGYTLHVGL